jgi:two-component system, OmpR family, response regulator
VNPLKPFGDPRYGSAPSPDIQYRMAANAYIVEDNDLIRDNLVETLTELAGIRTIGHSATEADACSWLEKHPGEWDLLVVDLFLQQGNGLGVLRKCLQRSDIQRVVVLSNYATDDIRHRCMACGADAIFDKSTELDLFIDYCSAPQ